MKNIHLIPTDKPSRLYLAYDKDYYLSVEHFIQLDTKNYKSFNIYITSDEEIKEDEYYLGEDNNIYCLVTTVNFNGKKIILTTDGDLIKDGVQSIDDEFLEWFVKNPNCEEAKVEITEISCIIPNFGDVDKYRIAIPKEESKQTDENGKPLTYWGGLAEPKQETLEDYLQRLKERRTEDDYKYTDEDFEKYKEYISDCCKNGMSVYKCLEFMYFAEKDIDNQLFNREHKQETLEEASSKVAHMLGTKDSFEYVKMSFELGAKWQQNRSYSEEEVLELLLKMNDWPTTFVSEEEVKEWFEQFKKK